jgi:phosphoglycolate phosphatase
MHGKHSLKLCAFDLDGTLLDSTASIIQGVTECWQACGFPEPDPSEIKKIIGLPWEESISLLLPGSGDAERQRIRNFYSDISREDRVRQARREKLFPGVREMLEKVERSGALLAIITSRSGGRLRELLRTQDIETYFTILKTPDNGPGKPNPDLMLQALEETGVEKTNAMMIGDTTFDIQMARNAGSNALGVSWGVHQRNQLLESGADDVVENMDEIFPKLSMTFLKSE